MNAKKLGGIKFFFERVHCLAQQMVASAAMQFGVITRGSDPVDVFRQNHLNSRAGPHQKPRNIFPGALSQQAQNSFRHSEFGVRILNLSCPFDRSGEAFIIQRLEEIVQSMDFERTQGVFLVSREENDQRQILAWEGSKNFKAIHARHLHVKKDDIGGMLENVFDSGRAIAAFADDLYIRKIAQADSDAAASQGFVVHNQRAHRAPSVAATSLRKGISMVTS